MTLLNILVWVLVFACAFLVFMLLRAQRHKAAAESTTEGLEKSLTDSNRRWEGAEDKLAEEVHTKNEIITRLTADLARGEERIESLTNQAKRDKEELEKLQASFRLEFRNLANEILEEKSTLFKKTNKESLNTLLDPFKESMKLFKDRVDHIYADENTQRGALQKELKILHELNKKITEETSNLTKALRGDSKVQGDWGEMILERILENSNLTKGQHYFTQETIKDEAGRNVRPDVIVKMPDDKQIVIDSKVSLTAFVRYTEVDEATARTKHMQEHLQSMRTHINELGSRRYQDSFDSIDFVIMFVPNEPAFLAALQQDPAIWQDAYNKKVIVSSPTNLFALLKIVDDLWRRDLQSKNALEIADRGGKLYDKFVNYAESLERLGRSLTVASDDYDTAMSQLSTGSGNLLRQIDMLRVLGVKATKTLSQSMQDSAGESDLDKIDAVDE